MDFKWIKKARHKGSGLGRELCLLKTLSLSRAETHIRQTMQLLSVQNPKTPCLLPQISIPYRFFSPKPSLFSAKFPRKLSLQCRRSEFFEQQQFSRPSDNSYSQKSVGAPSGRVYVGYSIYKGKAALTIDPRAPEFVPLDSGAFKLSREGYVLLQFAPAVGLRQYDWSRKQVFSLSVTEIGTLMSLGAKDSCEFFHDPNKGKSEEGKVRKILKAEPLPDGVQNRLLNVDESIYIPVTKAEFTVLISAFNFILPYLLGWHAFANSTKPDDSARSNNANPRSGAELEWGR